MDMSRAGPQYLCLSRVIAVPGRSFPAAHHSAMPEIRALACFSKKVRKASVLEYKQSEQFIRQEYFQDRAWPGLVHAGANVFLSFLQGGATASLNS